MRAQAVIGLDRSPHGNVVETENPARASLLNTSSGVPSSLLEVAGVDVLEAEVEVTQR